MKTKQILIWCISVIIFLVSRFIFSEFFSANNILLALIYFFGIYWFVCPYIMGDIITLPNDSTDEFKKGENDTIRFIFFCLGLFMCSVAMI